MSYSVSAEILVIHKLKGINQPHMQPTAHCTYKSEYKKGSDYAKSYKIQHGIIQEVIQSRYKRTVLPQSTPETEPPAQSPT